MQTSNSYTRFVPYFIGGIALGASAYFMYRWRKSLQPVLPQNVEAKLPMTEGTITDFEGNYDIDGVSYDVEGVIVSSDNFSAPSSLLP